MPENSVGVKIAKAGVSDLDHLSRLDKNDYLMLIAWAAARRSTCPRKKCGAVVSEKGIVLSTGYNGAPIGQPHCIDVGCLMQQVGERERCRRIIHGEVNAIRHAGGRGDTLHTTGQPCYNCLMEIISNPQLKIVYWWEPYPDSTRDEWLRDNVRGLLNTWENLTLKSDLNIIKMTDWSPEACLRGEI